MKLVERHIICRKHPLFAPLDRLCFLSKNLYNAALYEIRQRYINDGAYLNYYEVNRLLHDRHDENYFALPSNTSQETLKIVDKNYKSFFAALKTHESNKPVPRLPKYLHKENGRQVVVYNKMTLSRNCLAKGVVRLPKTDIEFKSKHCADLTQVRIVPKTNCIVAEVVYNADCPQAKPENGRYMAIDLGVNNLATCTSNVIDAFIVNGRPVKSINQYYNKTKAKLQSKLPEGMRTSRRIKNLDLKRSNKIRDYLHKASTYIVNQAADQSINTIVIGKNDGWKQDTNMGRRNNQNFASIPFDAFIQMILYKSMIKGIRVVLQEESYTSKASFFDDDYMPVYGTRSSVFHPSGKRINRGLYKTSCGALINADVNGSLNILRKHLKVASDKILSLGSRGLVVRPVRITLTN